MRMNDAELKSKELTEEDLQNVMGGFSGHVGKYDGVVGEKYYFVLDGSNGTQWMYGKLTWSGEIRNAPFTTIRWHYADIEKWFGGTMSFHAELCGDDWTMYKYFK